MKDFLIKIHCMLSDLLASRTLGLYPCERVSYINDLIQIKLENLKEQANKI